MVNESSIKDIISNSLDQIRAIIDADTVVGKQIVTPNGVVIIPISKVSMGFASGGLDLPAKTVDGTKNFGGGGGSGVTVVPVGFLTVSPDGQVDLIPMAPDKASPIEQIADIINSAPDIIGRIKNVFVKGNDEEVENVSELEESYYEKLAQEAADAAVDAGAVAPAPVETAVIEEEVEEEPDEIVYFDDLEEPVLTKAEKKRLKKEEKARKKLEKLEKKMLAKQGVPEETIEIVEDQIPVSNKKGKISEKVLESGNIK